MSRNSYVIKGRRLRIRTHSTDIGLNQNPRILPLNTYRGMEEVDVNPNPMNDIPTGADISISNRSDERKKN